MEPRFCDKCGKELVKKDLDSFNTDTGERNYHLHCPSNLCDHYGIYHDHETVKISWWRSELRCKKCNVLEPSEMRM